MQRRIFYDRAHPDFAETLQSLGESFRKRREFSRALDFFERAYDMRKKIYKEMAHQHLIESLKLYIHFQWICFYESTLSLHLDSLKHSSAHSAFQ